VRDLPGHRLSFCVQINLYGAISSIQADRFLCFELKGAFSRRKAKPPIMMALDLRSIWERRRRLFPEYVQLQPQLFDSSGA
jgi:hypothetical protein